MLGVNCKILSNFFLFLLGVVSSGVNGAQVQQRVVRGIPCQPNEPCGENKPEGTYAAPELTYVHSPNNIDSYCRYGSSSLFGSVFCPQHKAAIRAIAPGTGANCNTTLGPNVATTPRPNLTNIGATTIDVPCGHAGTILPTSLQLNGIPNTSTAVWNFTILSSSTGDKTIGYVVVNQNLQFVRGNIYPSADTLQAIAISVRDPQTGTSTNTINVTFVFHACALQIDGPCSFTYCGELTSSAFTNLVYSVNVNNYPGLGAVIWDSPSDGNCGARGQVIPALGATVTQITATYPTGGSGADCGATVVENPAPLFSPVLVAGNNTGYCTGALVPVQDPPCQLTPSPGQYFISSYGYITIAGLTQYQNTYGPSQFQVPTAGSFPSPNPGQCQVYRLSVAPVNSGGLYTVGSKEVTVCAEAGGCTSSNVANNQLMC